MDTDARRQAASAARAHGHTYASIAREIGSTRAAVSAAVTRGSHSRIASLVDDWLSANGFAEGNAETHVNAKDLLMQLEKIASSPGVTEKQISAVKSLMSSMADYIHVEAQQHREIERIYNAVQQLHDQLSDD